MKKWISNLAILAGSSATLICCVIPALMVSLGLGATLVSTIEYLPWLPWLSQYKWTIFIIAGILLIWNSRMLKKQVCAIEDKERCEEVSVVNRRIHYFAVTLYLFSLIFNLYGLL